MLKKVLMLVAVFFSVQAMGQTLNNTKDNTEPQQQENINKSKFRQLGQELPTPNVYRSASGAPGHMYWQQKADYKMDITLDDKKQRITGEETITYHNNSPDELKYLWVQLDQNVRALDSDANQASATRQVDLLQFNEIKDSHNNFDGGFKIDAVKDASGKDLDHTINKTMMRVDMPKPLKTGESFTFGVDWWYNVNDRMQIGGRSGYEYFEEDDNYLYTIAQFFPRMCVYDDINGWQNKQFLGRGEFALTFGDYEVSLTVPADHLVAATGELQNASEVMTPEQMERLAKAKTAKTPVIVATQEEAIEREKSRSTDFKTWKFKAENVRDFGFASSRKFIWDAQGVPFGDRTVMAMSMYPKEGNPLWEEFSTLAIVQTLETYSRHTFDYPYPVAWSINAAQIGMEYPMICFNYGRCDEDGSYSDRTKYGMISVIIHEVGHNYFPMIINSDERQWTWMDEGLNTFCQYLTEVDFGAKYPKKVEENGYPSRRGPAANIVDYMKGDKSNIMPIMTNSESIPQFGANAYAKPATALNILRETVMGPELFDYAFREYAQRWMFKHPSPADFFRTMEDASGVDLDWFWRGWFYTTDHVDIGIEKARVLKVGDKDEPKDDKKDEPKKKSKKSKKKKKVTEEVKKVLDVNPFPQVIISRDVMSDYAENFTEREQKLMNDDSFNYYQVTFNNKGGLVMPLLVEFEFTDGSKETRDIPANVWKMKDDRISKLFVFKKEIKSIELDPDLMTADVDVSNNSYPRKDKDSKFDEFKEGQK